MRGIRKRGVRRVYTFWGTTLVAIDSFNYHLLALGVAIPKMTFNVLFVLVYSLFDAHFNFDSFNFNLRDVK